MANIFVTKLQEVALCNMNAKRAEVLVEKGRKHLAAEKYEAAERAFKKALEIDDAMPIRNNLALAIFMTGEPQRALQVLEPYVGLSDKHSEANPFSHALAARIYCSLDQKETARRQLEEATRKFDRGLADLGWLRQRDESKSFREYTVTIMWAAADLRDHRLVFDLYRRWESYHVSWENKHLAAVASFNLGRFKRSANLWSSIAGVHPIMVSMQRVALLVDRGVIPPFELGYELYSSEKMKEIIEEVQKDKELLHRYTGDGYVRMMLLSFILEENSKETAMAMQNLVAYGGEWGAELGKRVLESSLFSTPVKMAAAQALVDRGIYKEDQPVSMVIDGERRVVQLKTIKVSMESDPELDKLVDRAITLRDEGRIDEAVDLLEKSYVEGRTSFRALITLANLLRRQDRLDEALNILQTLVDTLPDSPLVLFNLSALLLQMGRLPEAREYMEKIDPREQGKEFQEKLQVLQREIEKAEDNLLPFDVDIMVQHIEEEERKKVEEKPITVDVSLSRGLKNMPAGWLDGICRAYGIQPARLRKNREEQIREFLSRYGNLEKVVQKMAVEERELLRYLLEQGGWSRLNAVTRKFGSLEGDGFYWEECEPESPLGVLWSRALVMVGKANLNGRRCKVAAVPVELRESLSRILDMS